MDLAIAALVAAAAQEHTHLPVAVDMPLSLSSLAVATWPQDHNIAAWATAAMVAQKDATPWLSRHYRISKSARLLQPW